MSMLLLTKLLTNRYSNVSSAIFISRKTYVCLIHKTYILHNTLNICLISEIPVETRTMTERQNQPES